MDKILLFLVLCWAVAKVIRHVAQEWSSSCIKRLQKK